MIRPEDLGLTVAGGSGDEVIVLCPFHEDHRPSASFNRKRGLFYCHACGIGMNVEQLTKRLGIDLLDIDVESDGSEPLFSIELMKREDEIELGLPAGEEVISYLMSRNVDRRSIREYFRMRVTPKIGALIELKDHTLKTVGSVSRTLPPHDKKVKYLVSGDKPCLWPFQDFDYDYHTLIFVEGIFARVRMNQVVLKFGYSEDYSVGVFSLLGARVNRGLVPILAQTVAQNIIFLFDNDNAGQRGVFAARRMFPQYSAMVIDHEIDELPDDKIEKLVKRLMK